MKNKKYESRTNLFINHTYILCRRLGNEIDIMETFNAIIYADTI